MSKLHIYRASAGSGKTYTISREYIGLLFENPDKFRHILAVTFTNKATAEMKGRILKELFFLASGKPSHYLSFLIDKTKTDEMQVRDKAAFILKQILHNYSHFTISTIDSFFQRVIRSFARELGLYSGFEVELDTETVLGESIEMLFQKTISDEKLRKWLVQFAEAKIEDGKSWNLKDNILEIGKEIYKEVFKDLGKGYFSETINRDKLESVLPALDVTRRNIEKHFREVGERGMAIMQQNGLAASDFKGKSRSFASVFQKAAQKVPDDISNTVRNAVDTVDEWTGSKNAKQREIETAFHSGLKDVLKELVTYYDENSRRYNTIIMVKQNLYVLGIIADLMQEVKTYASEKNLFILADSTTFLNKIIEGSDAPFVYEKTGSRVQHFMIDEFQDTSKMQWENFRPLLENSLADNCRNWVVGDVKQSIYRWRNSDWTILSDAIFRQFDSQQLEVHPLDFNWRSTEHIIRFNNSFFTALKQALQSELDNQIAAFEDIRDKLGAYSGFFLKAYNDCIQKIPSNKQDGKGYIRFEFFEGGQKTEEKDAFILPRTLETVEQMQELGYALSDIAILVRNKGEGERISNYFMKEKHHRPGNYRYDLISSDTLFLKNAPVVQWISAMLRYLLDTSDTLTLEYLKRDYLEYLSFNRQANDSSAVENSFTTFFDNTVALRSLPVFELVDSIIAYFRLNEDPANLPYLQSFQDTILQYARRNPVDLSAFMVWWEENLEKQKISMPENQDSIRLMTIHSSKGLEFKVVLIPYGDWEFTPANNNNYIWANSPDELFRDFQLLPVPMRNASEKSIFYQEYFNERIFSRVDNLNLLYVAFTRAIEKLIVFSPVVAPVRESARTGHLLYFVLKPSLEKLYEAVPQDFLHHAGKEGVLSELFLVNKSEYSLVIEYGMAEPKQVKEKEEKNDYALTNYYISSLTGRKARLVVSGEYRSVASVGQNSRVKGNLFHEIFQYIRTFDDVDAAILELVRKGQLPFDEMPVIKDEIIQLLNQKEVKEWFQAGWEVKTEADILLKTGQLKRPDRLMFGKEKVIIVDYKFGDAVDTKHANQVRDYMFKVKQMGYRNLEGYIWYAFHKKVVPVELQSKPVQGKLFGDD